jgi:hypothetical protein
MPSVVRPVLIAAAVWQVAAPVPCSSQLLHHGDAFFTFLPRFEFMSIRACNSIGRYIQNL